MIKENGKNEKQQKIVELNPAFRDYKERSEKIDFVLRQFRCDNVFVTLKGWRDEVSLLFRFIYLLHKIKIVYLYYICLFVCFFHKVL